MKSNSMNTLKLKRNKLSGAQRVKIIAFFVLLIVCAIWLFPILYMILTSVKTDSDIMVYPGKLFPTNGFTFERYKTLIQATIKGEPIILNDTWYPPVGKWVLNSLLIVAGTIVWQILVCTACAYAMVFLDFKFKKLLWAAFIASMSIPGIAGYVSGFILGFKISDIFGGYTKTYLYLNWIITGGASIMSLFLIKQFMESIPIDLVESARMDGCSDFRIFWRLIFPNLKGILFTISIMIFLGTWNAYEGPALAIKLAGNDNSMKTLTVGLFDLVGNNPSTSGQLGLKMTACVIGALPTMLVYCICSNKIVEGVAGSGVKR